MAEAPLLRLEGVTKRFKGARRGAPPVEALRGVSLSLAPGQRLGLVGPDAGDDSPGSGDGTVEDGPGVDEAWRG